MDTHIVVERMRGVALVVVAEYIVAVEVEVVVLAAGAGYTVAVAVASMLAVGVVVLVIYTPYPMYPALTNSINPQITETLTNIPITICVL